MEDELDRIIAYFSLSPEEKEKKLETIFSDSVEYFARFRHIMENGTPEENHTSRCSLCLCSQCIFYRSHCLSDLFTNLATD